MRKGRPVAAPFQELNRCQRAMIILAVTVLPMLWALTRYIPGGRASVARETWLRPPESSSPVERTCLPVRSKTPRATVPGPGRLTVREAAP